MTRLKSNPRNVPHVSPVVSSSPSTMATSPIEQTVDTQTAESLAPFSIAHSRLDCDKNEKHSRERCQEDLRFAMDVPEANGRGIADGDAQPKCRDSDQRRHNPHHQIPSLRAAFIQPLFSEVSERPSVPTNVQVQYSRECSWTFRDRLKSS